MLDARFICTVLLGTLVPLGLALGILSLPRSAPAPAAPAIADTVAASVPLSTAGPAMPAAVATRSDGPDDGRDAEPRPSSAAPWSPATRPDMREDIAPPAEASLTPETLVLDEEPQALDTASGKRVLSESEMTLRRDPPFPAAGRLGTPGQGDSAPPADAEIPPVELPIAGPEPVVTRASAPHETPPVAATASVPVARELPPLPQTTGAAPQKRVNRPRPSAQVKLRSTAKPARAAKQVAVSGKPRTNIKKPLGSAQRPAALAKKHPFDQPDLDATPPFTGPF
jgi:hypothetical protein